MENTELIAHFEKGVFLHTSANMRAINISWRLIQ